MSAACGIVAEMNGRDQGPEVMAEIIAEIIAEITAEIGTCGPLG